MLALLLIAQAATPATAADAERAFAARAAATNRQWATFREWSTPDAVMFVPQPVKAHDWLAKAKEPARAVRWAPSESYVSCDGRWAVNTGRWVQPGTPLRGWFTTVWQRQPGGGWKWIYDAGDADQGEAKLPAKPAVRRAACRPKAEDALGAPESGAGLKQGEGRSPDGTLQWRWTYTPEGARALDVYQWNGMAMDRVIEDRVDPRAKP